MGDNQLKEARETLIQAMGQQSSFWGLGKITGEMYAALYLSPHPLSLEELARELGVTKGNVSVAVRRLEQLGMVKRFQQRGDRRVFFTAETDFWRITHSVLGLRHKPEFDQTFALVEESARLAAQAEPSPERDIVTERLKVLQEFYQLLDSIVKAVTGMGPEKLKMMVQMLNSLWEKNGAAGNDPPVNGSTF